MKFFPFLNIRIIFFIPVQVFCVISLLLLTTTKGLGQSLTINGGDQNITIKDGIPNGQLADVTNANCSLAFKTKFNWFRGWKITVSAVCLDQNFSLRVVATGVSPQGTAAPPVTLSTDGTGYDFITGLPWWVANCTCTLQYTASATFAQGHSGDVGNDIHTITYTLQQQ